MSIVRYPERIGPDAEFPIWAKLHHVLCVRYWEFQDIGDSLKWYRVNPHLDLISNEELDAYQSEYPLRVLLNSHDLRDY